MAQAPTTQAPISVAITCTLHEASTACLALPLFVRFCPSCYQPSSLRCTEMCLFSSLILLERYRDPAHNVEDGSVHRSGGNHTSTVAVLGG